MTINNLGMIGNSFRGSYNVQGFSSCEYPANSNVEHLFTGGLWIGAKVNGGEIVVSTGAQDDPSGYATGKANFEFSAPIGSGLEERSSLLDSRHYTPEAVSHQDFVANFTDSNTVVPGTQIDIDGLENGPLDATVHFESYNWNFPFANFFVILNYTITNRSDDVWEDVHLGYWTDPVVRNVAVTPAGSGGSAFFSRGGNGYIDSLNLGYEFDATGDPGFTESYFGFKYLGSNLTGTFYHPKVDTGFDVFYNAWEFQNPTGQFREPPSDQARYQRMASGLNKDSTWQGQIKPTLKEPSNRSQLISAGPYDAIMPGESVNIAFAVVLGQKYDDGNPNRADTRQQKRNLIANAEWAQSAYNGEDSNFNGRLDDGEDRNGDGKLTRYVLPEPPAIPDVKMVARDNQIELFWSNNSQFSIDPISQERDFEGYRLYKTPVGFDIRGAQDLDNSLELVAQFDSAGNGIGFDNGLDSIRLEEPKTFEDDTTTYQYHYVFDDVLDGWQQAVTITAFDQGDPENDLGPLESSRLTPLKRIFPGKQPNEAFEEGKPFVYPNPYYAGASWEGQSALEEDRKLYFANLPPDCRVRIYSVAGDLIHTFEHHASSYQGQDARWFETYSEPDKTAFAGGEHAWNLLSTDTQIIARGLYVFSVENLKTGEVRQGKFVVIK
jgi:hypothetical protein